MQIQCPQFSERTEKWIDETSLNEITIDENFINSINLKKCETIKEFDWIYSDLLEGDLIFRFTDNELEVKNIAYGDLTTYEFEIRENCQINLTLKASNNPFELLFPFKFETKMYVTNIESAQIHALYQLDENLYKQIRLKKKK